MHGRGPGECIGQTLRLLRQVQPPRPTVVNKRPCQTIDHHTKVLNRTVEIGTYLYNPIELKRV